MKAKVWRSSKIEEAKKGAYKGRGESLEWRIVKKQTYQLRRWSEDCWARILSWFRECILQRNKSVQAGETEEEEMRQ